MVEIKGVEKHSLAEKAGLRAGDLLISIDGNEITDVLDYRFYLTEESITLLCKRGGNEISYSIKKDQYDDIGLVFETPLMDKKPLSRLP